MTKITNDKWDKEVWGAATSEGTNERDTANSNLTFYWGEKVVPIRVQPSPIDSDIRAGQLGGREDQGQFDSSSRPFIQ